MFACSATVMIFVSPNVTCFLFVRSRVAVLLNAVPIPCVVFLANWLMLVVGLALF